MYFIITLLMLFAISLIMNISVMVISDKKKAHRKVVALPKAYGIAGAICYIIFHFPIIAHIGTNDYSRPEMIVFFLVSIFLCFLIIIGCLNWRICYDNEMFEYRTIFRHSLRFRYSEVLKTHRNSFGAFIKVKGRWLIIDPYATGTDEFLETVYIKLTPQNASRKKGKNNPLH